MNSGYVIALGASAGGLEALTAFFRAMPADSGLVFIVVQHLSPNAKSMLHELLAAHTAMPVMPAENGMNVAPNCVYIQPPQTNLNLFKGRLLLDDAASQAGLHLPIDYFFRSLAEDRKDRAVGIILSGTGSDGSRGIAALRQTGGMIMVQEPADASFNGMPNSAIATGLADCICPAAEMPGRLTEYLRNPQLRRDAEALLASSEQADLTRIIALLRTQSAVDFSLYKPSTILRRISRRMAIARCDTLRDYVEFLMQQPQEVNQLFRDLLIGVTKFFRDKREFSFLRDQIIPLIFENAAGQDEIRVWDAGCSSGEEVYTVAMLLHDQLVRQHGRRCKIKVFATDLDPHAIDKAARGFYPDGIAADLPADLLKKYFSKVENGFVVRRHIRELVIFAQQNLLSDPPFTRLDLVVCRNLLIYFHAPQQKEVLSAFHFALKEGGFLFLGNSESVLDMGESFAAVDSQIKIYRHIGRGSVPLQRGLGLAAGKLPPRDEIADLARRIEMREAYYQRIVSRLAAACVVLSESGEVLESFGRTDMILQPQPGRMVLNINSMISSALLLPVTTALRACQREAGWEVVYEGIKVHEKSDDRYLLRAVHLAEENSVLIALERMPAAGLDKKKPANESSWQMLDLQREVQFARENLEAANEELQTSNEELLAANEELIASNEAMQHTNEELNSVNEELSTVNAEYQAKIMELTELYNDLDNLFRSTDIGFIFVDRQLRIRKYTPAAGKLMHLMEHDLGRRISELAAPLLGDIEAEFNELLFLRKKKEKIVRHGEGCWYLVQFIPYMDETNEVSGMVVSIVDVSLQKRAEESLRQSSEVLEQILAASPAPTMMVTPEGRISFANEMASALFGIPAPQLLHQPLCSGQFDFTDLEGSGFPDSAAFVRTVTDQAEPLIVRLKESTGGAEYFLGIKANTLSGRSNGLNGVVLTFTEVARRT